METKSIISELSNLDLSKRPYEKARSLIQSLDRFIAVGITYPYGKKLIRARANIGDEIFYSKCQLSYKPAQFNSTYQRASTPKMTMFYASDMDESSQQTKGLAQVIGIFESVEWLRNNKPKGIQKVTLGRWIVMQEITLLAIFNPSKIYDPNPHSKLLNEAFNDGLSKHPEFKEDTIVISDFFAKEFSKINIRDDYDYLLSALFTEAAINLGFDGVLYPSVKAEEKGFNVAIKPKSVDSFLEMDAVSECILYKNLDKMIVDYESGLKLYQGQTHFKLEIAKDPNQHLGQEYCLRDVGVNDVSELTQF